MFTGTLTVADEEAEYTISEELSTVEVTVTVEAPTAAQITAAIAAVNSANAGNIIAALQSPVLGLTDINEDLATDYVAEVLASVTNTKARIQQAVNRVNTAAAEADQDEIDNVNTAVNFTDLRAALTALGIDNVATSPSLNQEYFDAIDANTTETKEQIQAVIDAVNLAEITAAVVKAETDLTPAAHTAADTLVQLDLLEEAVQTDLEDRLVAVDLIINVNAAGNAGDLQTALQALETAELIEGYNTSNQAAYFTAFGLITEDPEFTTVAGIQTFVTTVNANEATALIDAVNVATAQAAMQVALDAVTGDTASAEEVDLFLEVYGATTFTSLEQITDAFADVRLTSAVNEADESETEDALDALEFASYVNLGADRRAEVAALFFANEGTTEFETVAEVEVALQATVEQYNALLSAINGSTTISGMKASLKAVSDAYVGAADILAGSFVNFVPAPNTTQAETVLADLNVLKAATPSAVFATLEESVSGL